MAGVAAGLAESIARDSLSTWTEATGVAVQALVLRRRADTAGRDNAEAYATARRWLAERADPRATGRDAMLQAALLAAADALLVITAAAADCATLAAEIAAHCRPELEADAAAAAELAATAARAAASLVDINLALTPSDTRRGGRGRSCRRPSRNAAALGSVVAMAADGAGSAVEVIAQSGERGGGGGQSRRGHRRARVIPEARPKLGVGRSRSIADRSPTVEGMSTAASIHAAGAPPSA